VSLNLTAFAITPIGSAQHTVQAPFLPLLAGWSIHAQALVR
jgi:hypothetical protein